MNYEEYPDRIICYGHSLWHGSMVQSRTQTCSTRWGAYPNTLYCPWFKTLHVFTWLFFAVGQRWCFSVFAFVAPQRSIRVDCSVTLLRFETLCVQYVVDALSRVYHTRARCIHAQLVSQVQQHDPRWPHTRGQHICFHGDCDEQFWPGICIRPFLVTIVALICLRGLVDFVAIFACQTADHCRRPFDAVAHTRVDIETLVHIVIIKPCRPPEQT